MIDGQKATLPIQPNDPWYNFVECFDALPFKPKNGQKQKAVLANSRMFSTGLTLSSTFFEDRLTLRVIFDTTLSFLVGKELLDACRAIGWSYHSKAPESLLFRSEIQPVTEDLKAGAAFIPLLTMLGVDPNQDWGC
jgi:hypothetical protein